MNSAYERAGEKIEALKEKEGEGTRMTSLIRKQEREKIERAPESEEGASLDIDSAIDKEQT